jgi:hypothetical protein
MNNYVILEITAGKVWAYIEFSHCSDGALAGRGESKMKKVESKLCEGWRIC